MSLFPDDISPPGSALPGLEIGANPSDPHGKPVAYRVLARKYRPLTFDDLIGQDVLVRILRNAFRLDRVAHAFMLTGVRGVGKTTTARIIARCLNCVGPDGTGGATADPCGVCANCAAILADRHPDVTEMDAASNTGVDDVREIIEAARFRPMQARTRVFIVDEVHMLSRNAFNALLKTLEEPPPHVKFVFATTDIRKVPVTVLSRCQRFDLRRVSFGELSAHFARIAAAEHVTAEAEALSMIARAAEGSVRDGLSLLDQAIAQTTPGVPVRADAVAEMLGVADRDSLFDLLEALFAGRAADVLAITDRAHERGGDLGVMLADILELVHVVSRLQVSPELRDSRELPESERVRGAKLADQVDVPELGRLWQLLLKGVMEVEQAVDRRAAAEMVLIRCCYVSRLPPPAELVRQLTAVPASPAGSGLISGSEVGARGRPAGGTSVAALARSDPSPAPVRLPTSNPAQNTVAVPERVQAPRSFGEAVALVAEAREATLAAHLRQSVHLVRFAANVIELRPEPEAPRDLASQFARVLGEATGTRWTIALSTQAGAPTLAAQRDADARASREGAARHPLVQAILEAFPGAVVTLRDAQDAVDYGSRPASLPGDPEGPEDWPEPMQQEEGDR